MSDSEFNEKKLKEKLEYHIMRALIRIGQKVRDDAFLITPVDTGRLRNSLTYETQKKNKSVVIGTNVEYALAVEKGIGQSPQPYLTPAGERNTKKIEQIIAEEMRGLSD